MSLVAAVADLHRASFRIRNAWPGLWVGLLFPAGQGAGRHPGLECQALALALVAPSLPALAARLGIELTGVKNDYGLVRVAVCTPAAFTTNRCPVFGAAPARPGSVLLSLKGIPPGRYAVQAYHDEDGNGRLRHVGP